MNTSNRQILVTSALPYANGSIHLGHMVEYIQTDVWVRFQKMSGHTCYYVCADDAHGTPIMLHAEKRGLTPEQLIAEVGREHQADFADFLIGFDHYHSTHSPENKAFATLIYQRQQASGHIETRTIKQAFDPIKQLFLPDRFIKGECPRCGAKDQYGDNCEACGATYAPTELKNAISAISGAKPIEKDSLHYFFKLNHFESMLKTWTHSGALQAEIANKLDEWFTTGLQDWDISRDAPYFGFEIPDAPGKYFYVWLDAPIGYMASFKHLCDTKGIDFDAFWSARSQAELYHFIGKDIVYFHTLFWPALLEGAGFRKPTAVFAHGFLTINGQKMSKSRGTFVKARSYLNHLQPEYLRYYFAAKLSSRIEDLDLNLDDFAAKVNADLVGKVINIASRCAGFITKHFDSRLDDTPADNSLHQHFIVQRDVIARHYEARDFAQAMREIMGLADRANQYIDSEKPWAVIKDPARKADVHRVCSIGLNLFRVLIAYLKPVLPATAAKSEAFLCIAPLTWEQIPTVLSQHTIGVFEPLLKRIEPPQLAAILAESAQEIATAVPTQEAAHNDAPQEPFADTIGIDDFSKVDLRVARILNAQEVVGSDKLLQLTVDLGTEQRTIFAGIKRAYQPAQLQNRLVVVVVNLAPRKMRFGTSEGMALAAGDGEGLFLLSPDSGATPGMRIK